MLDRISSEYNSSYFKDRSQNRNHIAYHDDKEFIKRTINKVSNLLDYGCGEMFFTKYLYEVSNEVSVYDPSQTIQRMDAYGGTYQEDNCDLVYEAICLRGVVQHLPEPFFTLSQLIRTKLRPGGYLIFLATPNTTSPYYYLNKTLPALVPKLNYWVPSSYELKRVMANYKMDHIQTYYPYLSSGYASPFNDHLKFFANLFGFRSEYPFWFSMMNSIYRKSTIL